MRTRVDLQRHLAEIGCTDQGYFIAVEALIFTPDGKLILEKRGPLCRDEIGKLEGVGGRFEGDDLHHSLMDEIHQEIGDIEVTIDRLLEVRQVAFQEPDREQSWVVVSFLCRLLSGQPEPQEYGKIDDILMLSLSDLYAADESLLSRSTVAARDTYRKQYGMKLFYEP